MRGEELYVGNDKEPYFRDADYVIHLGVTDLKIAGGLEQSDPMEGRSPKVAVSRGLRGLAKLEGRDKFAGAGFDAGKNPTIEFHLRTVGADETRFHWAASIGYSMPDWEFDTDPGFWVQGYCIQPEFDRVLAAVQSGHVERLRVALTTTMWTKQKSNGFMPGMPMILCVAPPTDKESATPALERGFIRSVTWDETYGARTPAPSDEDAPPPKPQPVELPVRVYSLLTAIVGLLAFLAVMLVLRR
jgi:hypothetical protein